MITREQLVDLYENKKESTHAIAKYLNTYPNAVRRMLLKYGIPIRDNSVAQIEALSSGRSKHPTLGVKLSEEIKQRIGATHVEKYALVSEEEKTRRSLKSKEIWENMDDDKRNTFLKKGVDAARLTTIIGSKLEKFLCAGLILAKYSVDFHKQFDLQHIDIFISQKIGQSDGVAIEVNGPGHYKAIWGEKAFQRRANSDAKKTGLLSSKNFIAIVVKNMSGKCSPTKMRNVLAEVINILDMITEGSLLGNYYEVEV